MHAQPTQGQRVLLGETTDTHQRGRQRDLGGLSELQQLERSSGGDNTTTAINHRSFRLLDESDNFIQRQLVGGHAVGVSAQAGLNLIQSGPHGAGLLLLHILREVEDHGSGATALSNVEGFLHDPRDSINIRDQIGVLHDRQRHANHVRFLEGTAADHRLGYLAGDGDQGTGIDIGVGDGCYQIGRSGTAGCHAHAGPAGGPGVAFGGETAALFVTGQDGADLRLRERLVDLHARASGVGEDDLAALALQCFDKDVAPEHQGSDVFVASGLIALRRGGRAHMMFPCSWPVVVSFPVWNKKPTTVSGRGFL